MAKSVVVSDRTKIQLLKRGKALKKTENSPGLFGRSHAHMVRFFSTDRLVWVILLSLSLTISLLLFPSVLLSPVRNNLGDVAPRDVKASRDFLIENKDLTEKDREKAAREVLPVYDFDPSAINLIAPIREAFDTSREHLSSLTSLRDEQFSGNIPSAASMESLDFIKGRFFETLRLPYDEKAFKLLVRAGFPVEIEEAIIRLITSVSEKGVVENRLMLKNQIEKGGIILHEISSRKEITVTDSGQFYDLEKARNTLRSQDNAIRKTMRNPELADIVTKLAAQIIEPNLTFNQRETELRKEVARESVKPIYYKIKKGEMLVREGERIGPDHIIKLSEEMRSQSRIDMVGRVPAMAILIGFLFFVTYLVRLSSIKALMERGRNLLFNAVVLLGLFVFIQAFNLVAEEMARGLPYLTSRALLFAMPVACGAMLVSIFQGMSVAVAFSLIISVLASLITGGRVEWFIYCFISSLVAAYGVRECNERGVLIKTGLLVGLLNIVLSLCVAMIFGSLYSLESIVSSVSGFAGGVLSAVIATGIIPLVEMSFGFTTDIKLLELSNLDQPLLRDLMVQAPGTYHHSVITSNLVEATAKAVQARPLLAKVSAYYHDIGKIKKPLYFIENQQGIENRHEKLAPSMSSLILTSHVKDGVDLAKEHKLGKEITDIIQQHHGSTLISYFYQKARERMIAKGSKGTEVKEEDFRYPGPKPQTKEAGLVMLADMVEAASRSLADPTPARIQGLVQKIINNVFSDGQLDECELTLKDLHEIAKSFIQILSGIFHHRIEYPEVVARTSKKGRNGNSDQVSAEDPGAKKSDDKAEAPDSLKRLGMS